VVALLMRLKAQLGLTFLFIAHDLRLVEHICDRVAVMFHGRVVEMGPVAALFDHPQHPYTRALLSAVPVIDPAARRERIPIERSAISRASPLREMAAGHWAAV